MNSTRSLAMLLGVLLAAISSYASGALVTNAPIPIDLRVTVQPIVLSNNDGSNTAEYFGTATQESQIISFIDAIWAQAGIDIDWLVPTSWNNTFANVGASYPRPNGDLSVITATGDSVGVGNADPLVLDMYFVQVAAGFPILGNNFVNGLAFLGGNGVTQHVGDDLPGFLNGREVVARVVAHEIGHNLGLVHLQENENLLQVSGSSNPGERLNATQINLARGSAFAVAVPEPNSAMLILATMGLAAHRRRTKIRA